MNENETKKKKTFGMKIRRLSLILLLAFIIFMSLILILVQFQFFRSFALLKITSIVNNELLAEISIGDLQISLLDGIKLYSVTLITSGDTLAAIPEIKVKFDISDLFRNRISVDNLELIEPTIKLFRSNRDSLWNYDKIAKPLDTPPDTISSELTLKINNLIMKNASFFMYDSTLARNFGRQIDFERFGFGDLSFKAEVNAIIHKNHFELKMKQFAGKEYFTGLSIDKFKFKATANKNVLSLKDIDFASNEQYLMGDIAMKNFNVFTEKEPRIEDAVFDIKLKIKNINSDFISYFEKIPIELQVLDKVDIDFSGTLDDMSIHFLELELPNSEVNVSGKVYNLLNFDNFSYELSLDESLIQRNDIINTLPSLELKDVPNFGEAKLKSLYLKGFADSVFANMNISTSIGSVSGFAAVNLKEVLFYSGNLAFTRVNLHPILNEPRFKSSLTGMTKFSGSGTEISNLKFDFSLSLSNSQFMNYNIHQLNASVNSLGNSLIHIDTLDIALWLDTKKDTEFKEFEIFDDKYSSIHFSGVLDFAELDQPKYEIRSAFKSVNLAKILNNSQMPNHITGRIELAGEGLLLDSLAGTYNFIFEETLFDDRALMPFEVDLSIKREADETEFAVNSDFLEASFIGSYRLGDLLFALGYQGTFLADFMAKKITALNPELKAVKDTTSIFKIEKTDTFPLINGKFNSRIKDISPLNIFLDDMLIFTKMDFELQIISTKSSMSVLIDSLEIKYFDMTMPDLRLRLPQFAINGRLVSNLIDSLPVFEFFELDISQGGEGRLNDLTVNDLKSSLRFDGENMDFLLNGKANKDFGVKTTGRITLADEVIKFRFDSLTFNYTDNFVWNSQGEINLSSRGNIITIDKFKLRRQNAETIELRGTKNGDELENINIALYNIPIKDFLHFSSEETQNQFEMLKFNVDSLKINISNNVFEPIIKTDFYSDSIHINQHYIGTLSANIKHDKDYISGNVFLRYELGRTNMELMNLAINYLPIYIGLDTLKGEIQSKKKSDILLNARSFPLEFLSPFVPGLDDIRGRADISLKLGGVLSQKPVYSGNIKSKAIKFRTEATNIEYNAETEVYVDNSRISIAQLNLRNVNTDSRFGRLGKAEIMGFVDMDDKFMPKLLDISIFADRLLVLSDNSIATMPDLYGDFIISTDINPIRFSGTLTEPNLTGDINIMYAEIKMPLQQKRQTVRTNLEYEIIGDIHRIKTITQTEQNIENVEDEQSSKRIGRVSERNIADLINYDLRIKMLGQFTVLMDMNLLGEMYAEIGTPDRNVPLLYQKTRDSEEAKLYGEVLVKENSTLKFIKQFYTSGTVQFPAGSIENPSLNLEAWHTGTMLQDGKSRRFEVRMYITGTKELPDIKFKYFIDGVEASGSDEQINEDALFLLVMGRTKTGSDASTDLLSEGFTSGFSSFATKALTEMLMNTGVIKSAEFNFGGNTMNFEQATLKISGQIYGGISWTIGGTIADLSSNNEITIDIPASEFLKNPFWSNFVLQVTKATTQNTTIITKDSKNWEVKIKFGSSW